MKAHEEQNDLLNGFIDGELSPRQRTEVKRLAAHDEEVQQRLRRLRNTRILLRSLPREDPPDEIAENVLAILERKTLLGERAVANGEPTRRYWLLRQIRAAAAVLVLLGGLSVLVWSIVAPSEIDRSGQVAVENETASPPPITVVQGTLELKLAASTDLAGLLESAIQQQGMAHQVRRENGPDRETFHFASCPRAAVGGVLYKLNTVWGAVNDATFRVASTDTDKDLVVESASPVMVARIFEQSTPQESWAVADQFRTASYPHTLGNGPTFRPVITSDPKKETLQNEQQSLLTGAETIDLKIILVHDSE